MIKFTVTHEKLPFDQMADLLLPPLENTHSQATESSFSNSFHFKQERNELVSYVENL
jgi:hypothetical protein